MTIAQFIVAYAVCWWLVLFMVLPHQAQPDNNPQPGHVPSAPKKPNIRQKCWWTSVLALLPTLLIYLVASSARAEDAIYHVGGGCHALSTHVAASDVAARDGFNHHGEPIRAAGLNPESSAIGSGPIRLPLEIPSERYLGGNASADNSSNTNANSNTSIQGRNIDLSESFLRVGELAITPDGNTLLNGQSISNNQILSDDCRKTAPQ